MNFNNRKRLKITLVVSIITFSIITIALNIYSIAYLKSLFKEPEPRPVRIEPSGKFDPLEFWEEEMERCNDTDLDIDYGDKYDLPYTNPSTGKEYEFEAREIEFESPNWKGEDDITIHGYLLLPEDYDKDDKDEYPACLCMHGLGGNANASFGLAYPYLEEGFIVLTHSHPGHGESEGAQPTPKNFYGGDDYNEDAHYYLTLCAAIQGLRVLENLTQVDNSSIMVTGGSYGAFNTMWLSSIAGERIAGAIPYIAWGDIKKNKRDPTKMLYWVWDHSPEEIPDDFWDENIRWFDPIYYLDSDKLPPILWQVGTNDEFFVYEAINNTYEAVEHDKAFLQIYPDGHHGFPDYEDTTKFFIDYIIDDDDEPPEIDVKNHEKQSVLMGDSLKVEAEVDSDKDVESVQVAYKYVDIVGSTWETIDLEEGDDDEWSGVISPGIITSKVDYFIIVNLEGDEDVWFTSRIYNPGILISNFTIPFYILLVAFIAIPAALIIRNRYKKQVDELAEDIKEEAKKNFKIEMGLLSICNAVFFISIILPWAVFENGGVTWNHIWVMNNVLTWKLFFGVLAPYLTLIFFINWILSSHLTLSRPMLAGFLKTMYPLFVFLIFGAFFYTVSINDPDAPGLNFGLVWPGLGLYLMFFSSVAFGIIGIWKRKYQTKLGLREPKGKWYNIDRWFKINKPGIESKTPETKPIKKQDEAPEE